jgi:hypothetical protein
MQCNGKLIRKSHLTFENNHRLELNATGSKTNCNGGSLACIFCSANVDCLGADLIDGFSRMHKKNMGV